MKFGWGKTRVKGFSNNLETGHRQINWGAVIIALVALVAAVLYVYLETH